MGPGTLLSLFFCHLVLLASGNPAEAGEESVPQDGSGHHSFLHAEYNQLKDRLCNPRWTSHGFYCYRYFDTPRNFSDAEEECQSYGRKTHLASVSSRLDTDFLASLVANAESDVWVGLHIEDSCNTWTWTDGTYCNPDYTPWAPGKPDQCMNGDVCVQLTKSSRYYKWNDLDCRHKSGYICESRPGN